MLPCPPFPIFNTLLPPPPPPLYWKAQLGLFTRCSSSLLLSADRFCLTKREKTVFFSLSFFMVLNLATVHFLTIFPLSVCRSHTIGRMVRLSRHAHRSPPPLICSFHDWFSDLISWFASNFYTSYAFTIRSVCLSGIKCLLARFPCPHSSFKQKLIRKPLYYSLKRHRQRRAESQRYKYTFFMENSFLNFLICAFTHPHTHTPGALMAFSAKNWAITGSFYFHSRNS